MKIDARTVGALKEAADYLQGKPTNVRVTTIDPSEYLIQVYGLDATEALSAIFHHEKIEHTILGAAAKGPVIRIDAKDRKRADIAVEQWKVALSKIRTPL
jgi:hypothetical protein